MNICFVYVDLLRNVKPVKWKAFWDFKMILSLIRAILTSDLCFIWFANFLLYSLYYCLHKSLPYYSPFLRYLVVRCEK